MVFSFVFISRAHFHLLICPVFTFSNTQSHTVNERDFYNNNNTYGLRVTFSANNKFTGNKSEWEVGWNKKKHALWIRNNSKQWVLQSSIARQQMLFINHELASKQYAFAIAVVVVVVVVAVCFILLLQSSNVFGLLIWAHKTNTILYVWRKNTDTISFCLF